MTTPFLMRPATISDDGVIARHFYQLWRDNQIADESICSDWEEITQEFLDRARERLDFQAFIAESDATIIGSVSCQIFSGLYPPILTPAVRKYGYIWNVYVEPEHRQCGIGSALTKEACNYLKSIGCTQAILHASPYGRSAYSKLGFVENNEMRLNL